MENTKKKNWIIATSVAIIYLTVSILFDLWAFSWIIWVVYAIYRLIVNFRFAELIKSKVVKNIQTVSLHRNENRLSLK